MFYITKILLVLTFLNPSFLLCAAQADDNPKSVAVPPVPGFANLVSWALSSQRRYVDGECRAGTFPITYPTKEAQASAMNGALKDAVTKSAKEHKRPEELYFLLESAQKYEVEVFSYNQSAIEKEAKRNLEISQKTLELLSSFKRGGSVAGDELRAINEL